ncbi:hypothetical protein MLGJGCBP_05050 [Rhodococcus sp. T7]|nr:hypothetical protein MLGJGCBP_05050 [Rhodococcus sp. T7]
MLLHCKNAVASDGLENGMPHCLTNAVAFGGRHTQPCDVLECPYLPCGDGGKSLHLASRGDFGSVRQCMEKSASIAW